MKLKHHVLYDRFCSFFPQWSSHQFLAHVNAPFQYLMFLYGSADNRTRKWRAHFADLVQWLCIHLLNRAMHSNPVSASPPPAPPLGPFSNFTIERKTERKGGETARCLATHGILVRVAPGSVSHVPHQKSRKTCMEIGSTEAFQ